MITLASFVKVSLIHMSAIGKLCLVTENFPEFVILTGNRHSDKNRVR
jgi:hypothetical protein